MDLIQRIALEAIAKALEQSGHYEQAQVVSGHLLGEEPLLENLEPAIARTLLRHLGYVSLATQMDEVEASNAIGFSGSGLGLGYQSVGSDSDYGLFTLGYEGGSYLKNAESFSWKRILGF
jgi:hypothetical protein